MLMTGRASFVQEHGMWWRKLFQASRQADLLTLEACQAAYDRDACKEVAASQWSPEELQVTPATTYQGGC